MFIKKDNTRPITDVVNVSCNNCIMSWRYTDKEVYVEGFRQNPHSFHEVLVSLSDFEKFNNGAEVSVEGGFLIFKNQGEYKTPLLPYYKLPTLDFIEEVGETISRIDRMLYQLRNSGKLRDCAGIILGQFTDCPNEEVPQYTEIECLNDILRDIDVPVMYNIQSGHDHPMMTLPLGAVCTMDTFSRTIVFEAPER